MSAESTRSDTQFENPEATKLEHETNQDVSPRSQAEREAEKLARKSSNVEKDSERNQSIFSK